MPGRRAISLGSGDGQCPETWRRTVLSDSSRDGAWSMKRQRVDEWLGVIHLVPATVCADRELTRRGVLRIAAASLALAGQVARVARAAKDQTALANADVLERG